MTGGAPATGRAARRALEGAARHAGAGRGEALATAVAAALHDRPRVRRLLQGAWLGHAAHPMLTDFTDGPWMGASFLDLFGPAGSKDAARRLVAFGLLASVPTMLSGLADWHRTDGTARRVGVLHAATSSLATVLYGASYLARRRCRHRLGVVLGTVGGLVAFADGYAGGDLTLVGLAGTGRRA